MQALLTIGPWLTFMLSVWLYGKYWGVASSMETLMNTRLFLTLNVQTKPQADLEADVPYIFLPSVQLFASVGPKRFFMMFSIHFQLPYYDVVPCDPTIDEMREAVVVKRLRPESSPRWDSMEVCLKYKLALFCSTISQSHDLPLGSGCHLHYHDRVLVSRASSSPARAQN